MLSNNDDEEVDVEEEIDLMFIDSVRDVKLIALAYPAMHDLAVRIMAPHNKEILNNALKVRCFFFGGRHVLRPINLQKDYGPLSEGIQVKSSIVLSEVTRNGYGSCSCLHGRVLRPALRIECRSTLKEHAA